MEPKELLDLAKVDYEQENYAQCVAYLQLAIQNGSVEAKRYFSGLLDTDEQIRQAYEHYRIDKYSVNQKPSDSKITLKKNTTRKSRANVNASEGEMTPKSSTTRKSRVNVNASEGETTPKSSTTRKSRKMVDEPDDETTPKLSTTRKSRKIVDSPEDETIPESSTTRKSRKIVDSPEDETTPKSSITRKSRNVNAPEEQTVYQPNTISAPTASDTDSNTQTSQTNKAKSSSDDNGCFGCLVIFSWGIGLIVYFIQWDHIFGFWANVGALFLVAITPLLILIGLKLLQIFLQWVAKIIVKKWVVISLTIISDLSFILNVWDDKSFKSPAEKLYLLLSCILCYWVIKFIHKAIAWILENIAKGLSKVVD